MRSLHPEGLVLTGHETMSVQIPAPEFVTSVAQGLIDSTRETLRTAVKLEPTNVSIEALHGDAPVADVAAFAEFTGNINGTVSLTCDGATAKKIVQRMVGEDVNVSQQVAEKTILRLLTVMAPRLVTRLEKSRIGFTNPRIVSDNCCYYFPNGSHPMAIRLQTELGEINVLFAVFVI